MNKIYDHFNFGRPEIARMPGAFGALACILLSAVGLLPLAAAPPAPPAAGQAPAKPAPRVLAVLSSDSSIYEEGLAGIRSTTGAALDIVYLNILEAEESDARPFLERADTQDYALVVAIGAEAGQQVYAHVKKTPVAFSMLSVPRALPAPVDNLCGVSMRIPMEEYFRVLKEISPKARRVHSFFSTHRGEYLTGEGEYVDLQYGLVFSHEKVADPGTFRERLAAIKGRVDAFYIAADPLYDRRRFEQLSQFARENSIVLFSGFRSLVFAGATFGIAPDYNRIGSLTGRMIERMVTGRSDCAREGIILADRSAYFFYLNPKFARESRVSLPDSIRERARNVRLLRAGIEFFNEGKFKSARAIFDHLLERDPSSSAVRYYKERVTAHLNGRAIGALLSDAGRNIAEGKLESARASYERVLAIQPGHLPAKEGLARVSSLQQARAEDAYRGGRVFVALGLLEAAVRSEHGSERASSRLREIRALESHRAPVLIGNGRAMYTERNYVGAMQVFSDVLLLSPGNKTALEYLRLSRKKKAAMDRLREKIRGAQER